MKSLVSLVNETTSLIQRIIDANGEIDPETEFSLQKAATDLPEKVDRCSTALDLMERDIAYFKEKAKEFQAAANTLSNAKERFKDYIKSVLISTKERELLGFNWKLQMVGCKPALTVDPTLVPKEFKRTVIVEEVDREKVYQALTMGVPVDGAKLIKGYTLRRMIKK